MPRNPFLGAMKLGVRGGTFAASWCYLFNRRTETQREIRSLTLTLAQANKVVAAAIAQARQFNIIVNVAVCDNQGHLIAFNRMDRAYVEGDRFAIGKAVASAGTGLPSGEIGSRVDHPPVADVVTEDVPALDVRGGLPIFRSGQIEGGCGVDGAPSHHDQEEACARAGIARLGPQ